MGDAPFSSSVALIAEAKRERQRLLAQIEESQKTIDRSREVIARLDQVLAALEQK